RAVVVVVGRRLRGVRDGTCAEIRRGRRQDVVVGVVGRRRLHHVAPARGVLGHPGVQEPAELVVVLGADVALRSGALRDFAAHPVQVGRGVLGGGGDGDRQARRLLDRDPRAGQILLVAVGGGVVVGVGRGQPLAVLVVGEGGGVGRR